MKKSVRNVMRQSKKAYEKHLDWLKECKMADEMERDLASDSLSFKKVPLVPSTSSDIGLGVFNPNALKKLRLNR